MADLGSMFSSFTGGSSGMIQSAVIMLVGALVLVMCVGGLLWFFKKRKQYNLRLEIKIPRNIKRVMDNEGNEEVYGTLNKEWGKGFYDAKKGVVFIKRKGKKPVAMKPFDVKRFLSTGNILTIMQVGIEDYRPVLDESYIEVEDSETGEQGALIRAKIDTSESKSWKNSFEREAKLTYSIKNWIAEHGALVAMGIVLLMNLIGFSIVIARMPK